MLCADPPPRRSCRRQPWTNIASSAILACMRQAPKVVPASSDIPDRTIGNEKTRGTYVRRTGGLRPSLVTLGCILLLPAACSQGPSATERMQLQERCAAAAKPVFENYKAEAGGPDPYRPSRSMTYTNHYSFTRHKCYV